MIVDVAFPIPVAKTFSYVVPDTWEPFAKKFLRLKAPFHNRIQTGVITEIRDNDGQNLKEIHEIIDFFPLIDSALMELCAWASSYYATPAGAVLKYFLPPNLNIEAYLAVQSKKDETSRMNNLSLKKAVQLFGRETVFHYWKKNFITLRDFFIENPFLPIAEDKEKKILHDNVLFIGHVRSRLDYYTEVISSQLNSGSNVLMLLPDHHAAGNYFKNVFSEKFGDKVLWYGSETKTKSRMETFFRVRNGEGYLVLGNKSCVFLPLCKPGLVIVERHEEDEYRNEEGFKFNAVMVAVKRASISGIPALLGSASPSMEMYYYAEKNKFRIIEKKWLLDESSQGKISVPDIFSSATFLEELTPIIKEKIENRGKIAVFTPRKNYGSHLVCHDCKAPFLCPHCESVLDYEKEIGFLVCPACGKSLPYQEHCGNCGSNIIRFSRTGAEYVEEKLKDIFPDLRIIKITGDSLKNEIKQLKKASSDAPIVFVGTQSLSKLYNIHVQTLVLLGWEELRKMGGYRSDEKMIQILMNLIDALTPDSISIFMEKRNKIDINDYLESNRYYHEELHRRINADFPPFQRVFLVEIKTKSKDKGEKIIAAIRNIFQKAGIENALSGMLKEKKTQHKWKLILKGENAQLKDAVLDLYNLPGVHIEPDPLYF